MIFDITDKAYEFAFNAHKGQSRKGGGDYINHPILVAKILESHGYEDNVIAAGYLHDVAEDTQFKLEDMAKIFDSEIIDLIKSNTEDKSKSWIERKTHTIENIANLTIKQKALLAADKLANIIDISDSLKEFKGKDYWSLFNAGYESQKWYYTTVANELINSLNKRELKEHDIFTVLKEKTDLLFG